MTQETNALGQPVGCTLDGWLPPPLPPHTPLAGRYCRLEPLDAARHADALYDANSADVEGRMWTYLPYGPFADLAAYRAWAGGAAASGDTLFFAITDPATGQATGIAAYLRIEPRFGSVEVGHLAYAPALQRTRAATEAMYLMMKRAFDLGYRRYEWKCNALNAASRAAAQRLGFSFEGVFRQHLTVKGRNRDTAWYAVLDREWPALRQAFEQWLAPSNFETDGRQRLAMSDLTRPLLAATG